LREAVAVLRKLLKDKAFEEKDRDSIAQAMGHSSGSSGVAGRKIAALVHFGLLERCDSRYRLTELAHLICKSGSREGLQRAFLIPSLFQELVDRYRLEGAIPRYFAQVLPEHGVTEAVKHEVARIFMASGEYAGILAADGVFLDETPEVPEPVSAVVPEQAALPSAEILPAAQPPAATPDSNPQTLRFLLTDRKVAEMKFPAGLNEDDLQLIRKQIEFLELQVRLSRPAATLPFRRPGKAGESA
jgi:hypothetical protein